jgi:hypothetical protein
MVQSADQVSAPPSRRLLLLLFLGFVTLYWINGRAPAGADSYSFPYTAWSLLRHGSMDLRYYRELDFLLGTQVYQLPDGSRLSMRTPGGALVALPIVAPVALLCQDPPRAVIMFYLGKATSVLLVSGAAVLIFVLCRRLAPAAAWPATLLFGAGTCLFSVASQQLWAHGPACFWLCCALVCLLPRDGTPTSRGAFLAGCALGMAVFTRPSTAFFGMASGLALLLRRDWRSVFFLTLGAAVPLAGYCAINLLTFGDPFLGGYARDDWATATPLWLGISGLLIAPSRGVLVYTPAFLLLPSGLRVLLSRKGNIPSWPRVLLCCWVGAAAVTVAFFARWHDWYGGWCYGPRFLCECMPIACLVFAVAYAHLQSWHIRRLVSGLVALSVFIHAAGVFSHGAETDWYLKHEKPDGGRWLFAVKDSQIEAHTRAFVEKMGGKLGALLP